MGALFAAATLLATGAYAGDSSPQGKANGAEKAAEKADKKAEKAEDKADKKAEKAEDKAKAIEDRALRKQKEHTELREKLKGALKAPMDAATKQELRRHAEILARLERVKSLAQADKDSAIVDKATALVTKENARHDTWMSKHSSTPSTPSTPDKAGAQ
jgi:hypothetical protein